MIRSWSKGAVLLCVAILSATALSRAATSPSDAPSLAGQLLVASPEIGDPRFAHTVILVVRHGKDGALGIVINRPVEERPIAELLEAVGIGTAGVEGRVQIFAGGPVEPGIGFVVHSADYRGAATLDVDGRIAMTSSVDILRDIGLGKGPRQSLIAFGYAGWAPEQLEGEIARRDWFVTPEDAVLVFGEDRERVWEKALARRALDL